MKNLLRGAIAALVLALSPIASWAQSWPAKPVRFVVPYPPGGSNDILTRITGQAMSPGLGQPVVIDNRGGAGGMVGAEHVARSDPDGYTVVNVQASFTTNAAIRSKMPYDPLRDFAYIGFMARGPMLVTVHPSLPVKTTRELLALVRARPGQLNYGTSGTGGINHLSTELFRRMAGINIVHVPYKGIAPALTDLIGGHVQLVITSLPSAMAHVSNNRLRALAVGSAKRSAFAPQVPTVAESGVPGYVAELWWGLAAPAKTPVPILDRLASELGKALQSDALKKRFAAEGAEPTAMTRDEITRFVGNEIDRWRKVAQDAGIKPD